METLITPAEVAALAFTSAAEGDVSAISESAIAAAQQKFIKPVLNGLYAALEEGRYPELLVEYVKPALAQYVRYLVLSSVASHVGTAGVIQPRAATFATAPEKSLAALRRRARSDARTLMRRAVEHIETIAADYPEYDPAQNILNRVSIEAGVVL
ncbi:hypothetical protein LJC45_02050 [Alistipes sp. OttesenSCG-928-B03]|nr:hypothetical protein [Alistipes sp. OttesenSCG-928-B03]